jgi:hypothetical protein
VPQPTGPTGAPPGPVGGDYDTLINQAKTAWSQKQFPQVQQSLMQAMRSDPTKPRAYSGLAELQLYILGNLSGAMQNYQATLARGGEAVFHVLHDHSAETFVKHCSGFLYVSAKGVRFTTTESGHGFTAQRSDVREARPNRKLNLNFGRQNRPSIDPHAFHIRLGNGQNYNFAPTSRFTEEERNLILNTLGVN